MHATARLVWTTFATLLLALASPPARAADADGRFMVKGAGTATCERFLTARREKNAEYVSLAGWLDGYLSFMNQSEDRTFDVAPWQGTELLLSAVAVECRRNPQANFHGAAYRVATSLRPGRLQAKSPPVTATVDGKSLVLYAEVVTRIQQRLKLRGLFAPEPNGRYDADTTAALRAFQRDQQLPETGLPDQLTLAKLL
jgi:hypothetical protein